MHAPPDEQQEPLSELKAWLAADSTRSQALLAKQLNVTQGAISQWFAKGVVPPKRVPDVVSVTGIPAAKLNPVFASVGAPSAAL